MGKSLSIWAVCLTVLLAGFSFSGNERAADSDRLTIVNEDKVSIHVTSEEDFKFFLKTEFDSKQDDIRFLTRENTTQIRIYNNLGDMVYLLPVGSDRINVGRSLFEKGTYKFVFDTDGDRKMFTSNLTVR